MTLKRLVGHLQFNYTSYFVLLIADKIMNVIFSIYIVKLLTETEYGIYGFTISFSSFASNLLLMGIATPIVVLAGTNKNFNQNIEKILAKLVSVSSILYLVLLGFVIFKWDWVAQIFYNDRKSGFYLFIVLSFVYSDIIISYRTIHFRLFERFVDHARFLFQSNVLKMLVFIFVLITWENFFYAFFGSSLCVLLFVLFRYDFFGKMRPELGMNNFGGAKALLIEGVPFLLIYILMNVSLYLVNFLIVNELSLGSYSTYNFNFTFAYLPMSFIGYVSFYSFQNFVTNGSGSKLPRQVLADLSLGLVGIVVYYIVAWFAYDYILTFVGKESYSNFALFTIIYITMVMTAVINFLYFPLYKDRRYARIIFVTGLSVVVNVAYLYFNEKFEITTPSIGLILSQSVVIILFLISINERKVSLYSAVK